MSTLPSDIGIILVDHGSKRLAANDLLFDVVAMFKSTTGHNNVEAAHMELAEPSIATAFDRCVQRGATRVVVSPYFLLPGRHWDEDIPRLVAEAASKHRGVSYLVAAPIGLHPLMAKVIESRIEHCLDHAMGVVGECEVCEGTGRCRVYEV